MNIKSYITSIGAICIITVVAELLLPTGRLKKSARVVFSLMIVLALISPLKNPLNVDTGVFSFESAGDTVIDQTFLASVTQMRASDVERTIETKLESVGIGGAKVTVVCSGENGKFIVEKVLVNLENSVIDDAKKHINITVKTLETVLDTVNINAEDVEINE